MEYAIGFVAGVVVMWVYGKVIKHYFKDVTAGE